MNLNKKELLLSTYYKLFDFVNEISFTIWSIIYNMSICKN